LKRKRKNLFISALKHNSHDFSFCPPQKPIVIVEPTNIHATVVPPKNSFNVQHLLHIEMFQLAAHRCPKKGDKDKKKLKKKLFFFSFFLFLPSSSSSYITHRI
jgi:hypothetical protein